MKIHGKVVQPLDEAAGIRQLVETYDYNQLRVAKLLNKSKSYISQVLGLERLEEPAREIIRNASIPKEAQIQASRESDSVKQRDILIEASKDGNTIRKLRKGRGIKKQRETNGQNFNSRNEHIAPDKTETFHTWAWESPDKNFSISIRFTKVRDKSNETGICKKALKAALTSLEKNPDSLFPSPSQVNGHNGVHADAADK